MVLFSRDELIKNWKSSPDLYSLANRLRANALALVQEAGSGHIGSSFSVMDILLAIHFFEQGESFPKAPNSSYRVFSSKGHDAPAFYSMNHFLGLIPDVGMRLRRLGFLPGHPEIGTGGSIANTGSLGMGISKAKGFAAADHLDGRVTVSYVVLGDGELQEGQIWESITDASKVLGKVVAVVDGNSIQSDTWVSKTRDLGEVGKRVEACGWKYIETKGHDFEQLLAALKEATDSAEPVLIWANTKKGHGSAYLADFPRDGLFYHAHSGPLSQELEKKVREDLLGEGTSGQISHHDFSRSEKMISQSMPNLWAELLEKLASDREDIIVMDADLALDTGTYAVSQKIGLRYMQMGIAEQDMVTMAGSMSLSGYIPFVHSFSTFLTMRPFEQIVNNASERSRVVYVGFLAGIVPSAAGFSHQAVLDLAIMSVVPGMKIFEPATRSEIEAALSFALSYDGPTYLRMNSVSHVSANGDFELGDNNLGTRFIEGHDFTIVCSGSFCLQNSLAALGELKGQGLKGQVITLANKMADVLSEDLAYMVEPVLILENAVQYLGTFKKLENQLIAAGKRVKTLSINGFPANGRPDEVSKYHGFDPDSLVSTIQELLKG